ncbi:MAG: site-2 protease family protein [Deltaproteobacteria bacterium]|nr:site-2 protease family protein [Deltaproteobacteria bacterium]
MSVLYFLLLVSVLVVIHELGHFVAAKLLDVKVLRFSIGYGRPLVRVKLRDTEYQIAAFPLGGYVRILGIAGEDDRPDDKPDPRLARAVAVHADAGRSFAARPLWQRLVIVFAGPAANLVLAVAIYFVFFVGHTNLPAAEIGDVIEGGPAARAGLEAGDRVLEIDGVAVRYWEEIESAVRSSPGRELALRISRNGKIFERYLTPLAETVRSRDGGEVVQGRVGITHAPFIPIVGVIDAASPAARAGLRTGDLIISVDGLPVRNWTDVKRNLGRLGRRTSLTYFRGTPMPAVPQVQLLAAGFADLVPETRIDGRLKRQTYTGLEHAEMFVAHVDPGSPADTAGLHPGDLLVALDDKPVAHWMELDQRLQADPKHAFKLAWKRAVAGKVEVMTAELTQVWRKQRDEYGHTVSRLVFGARNDVDRGRGAMVVIDGRFGYAMNKALSRTGETISTMVGGFVQILGGDSPGEALGGPLMMYKVASVSGNQGWDSFLLMLALISVNLGLINLLPIPMLDGGHLLVFAAEAATRRPLSASTRERIGYVGLVIVVIITILALRADVMRFFF